MTLKNSTHSSNARHQKHSSISLSAPMFLWGYGSSMPASSTERVFNPFAPSNTNSTPESVYKRHENEKRRNYEERVREVEHGSFTPLVFSATVGMGKAATVMYQRLTSLLSVKRAQLYSKTMSWLRCQLTFSLLRSTITCIRGSRTAMNRPGRSLEINASIPLAASEGRIPDCSTKLPI